MSNTDEIYFKINPRFISSFTSILMQTIINTHAQTIQSSDGTIIPFIS